MPLTPGASGWQTTEDRLRSEDWQSHGAAQLQGALATLQPLRTGPPGVVCVLGGRGQQPHAQRLSIPGTQTKEAPVPNWHLKPQESMRSPGEGSGEAGVGGSKEMRRRGEEEGE